MIVPDSLSMYNLTRQTTGKEFLMREVAVIGIGQTKVDEHWNKSLKELAGEAVLSAVHDAGLKQVDSIICGKYDVRLRE